MGKPALERWEYFVRGLARHLQVKGIGAEVNFPRPLQGAFWRDGHLFENAGLHPSGENAAASERREVDNADFAIIVRQFDAEPERGVADRIFMLTF
jgi:hypothetical protein